MDNKKIIGSLFLGVLVLLTVYFVYAGGFTSTATVAKSGDSHITANTTLVKGGESLFYNFSITCSSCTHDNITGINITLPVNFTVTGSWSFSNASGNFAWVNNTDDENATNATNVNTWQCYNSSEVLIECVAEQAYEGIGNNLTILDIYINATATDENLYDAAALPFFINLIDNAGNQTDFNLTANLHLDDKYPLFSEVNVSDGNYTLFGDPSTDYNGLNGTIKGVWGETWLPTHPHLKDDVLTFSVTVTENNIDNVDIYYNVTNQNISTTAVSSEGYATKLPMTRTGTTNLWTATLDASSLDYSNISFIVVANDTVNHLNHSYNEYSMLSWNFTIQPDLVEIIKVNITDGTNTISTDSSLDADGGSYLLQDMEYTINVEVTGLNKTALTSIYYNDVGIAHMGTTARELSILVGNESSGNTIYNGTILKGVFNNTNVSHLIIYMNDTLNYTMSTTQLNFTADGVSPGATTTLSKTLVTTSDSTGTTATCTATDVSGIASYAWRLVQPDGTEITTGTSSTRKYSGSEINRAGWYSVYCTVTDNVGHSTGATRVEFRASSTTTGGGGTGGNGGRRAAPTFDIDFTEVDQGTLSSLAQGSTKIFTLDGTTQHTFKVDEVTETGVTVTVSSITPVTTDLEIGETKEVDMNLDGTNDISVTLDSITNGRAKFTIIKLAGAEQLVEELEEEAEAAVCGNNVCEAGENYSNCPSDCPAPTEEVVEEEKAPSKTWLWITLIVIVIIIVVYFLTAKKGKK